MYRCAIWPRVSAPAIAISFVFVILLLVAGCGAEESNESTRSSVQTLLADGTGARHSDLSAQPPALRDPALQRRSDAIATTAYMPSPDSPVASVRLVIKTATVECEVSDCDSTASEIEALVARKSGYIVSSTLTSRADGRTGVVAFRVPAQDFEVALAEVKALARTVERVDVRGDDVTEEFFDLTARLENKRRAEQRFLEILKLARKAPEIMEIETSLMGLREDIERLEGRKRYMEKKTALTTINVVMHEPASAVIARADGFWRRLGRGVASGAERGLNGIVHTASTAVALVVAAIPLVLGAVVLVWVAARTYRRLKPRRMADDATRA